MRRPSVIVLDTRLSVIASLVGRCERFADIGCDHGRLGAFLAQNGLCDRVQLTDISEPSLKKARELFARLDLNDRARFCVGDGARALAEPADVAVIAGMGGDTIAAIVRSGREALGDARLILQPNVNARELRAALVDCGYAIDDERVATQGRRCYVIISARPGEARYDERQLEVGPVLLGRMPPELVPYATFRLRVAQKALAGATRGGDAAKIARIEREIGLWEEVWACLQARERS